MLSKCNYIYIEFSFLICILDLPVRHFSPRRNQHGSGLSVVNGLDLFLNGLNIQNPDVDPIKSFDWFDLNWIRSLDYNWISNISRSTCGETSG